MWIKAVVTGVALDTCLFMVRFIGDLIPNRATGAAVTSAQSASVTILYLVVFLLGLASTFLVR